MELRIWEEELPVEEEELEGLEYWMRNGGNEFFGDESFESFNRGVTGFKDRRDFTFLYLKCFVLHFNYLGVVH